MRRKLSFAALCTIAVFGASKPMMAQDCTAPDGVLSQVTYNETYDAFMGCTTRGWIAFHQVQEPADPCDPEESPSLGTVCSNGSVYAGLSPDGNVPMYTTPADAPNMLAWGSAGITRGTTSLTAGEANTMTLAAFGVSAHPAALYCDTLSAHDADDWYLPAKDELSVLYTNRAEIGTFGITPHLSSSETSSSHAWFRSFSDGAENINGGKWLLVSVRCVRK